MSNYPIYLAVSFLLMVFVIILWSAFRQKKRIKKLQQEQFAHEETTFPTN